MTDVVALVLLILLASEAADVLGMDAGPRTPDMLKSVVLLFVIAILVRSEIRGKMQWGEPPPTRKKSLSMSVKSQSKQSDEIDIWNKPGDHSERSLWALHPIEGTCRVEYQLGGGHYVRLSQLRPRSGHNRRVG